ncbi:hypothetical protein [Amycolatopsis jiangsuensis]|uniref:Uncharacterized protein n=1 Tax=Amycolatopsis jiangsuensis TaxID=1181879 RepID=A0A840J0T8_9PSEU|nr:hypothetical protein [Amycolatopsis jiangsuensis]MBB4687052.1 hypothetical protein [Amycolatopsis jiangsuensis]
MSGPPDVSSYLRGLDVGTLADLLYAQARRDPELRHSLELRAATQSGAVSEAHRLLDTAVADGNLDYAAKIGAVLDTVARLLDAGSRADLAPLARRAVDDVVGMLDRHGDPSGDLGERFERAVGLYARACAARPPDPELLADWLLQVSFDGRPVELADFSGALGEPGTERVKSTVDEVLAGAPTGHRLTVAQRLQEEVAEVRGDVDGLVAILSAKPPRVDVSLKIVRVLRAAGRHSEAIAYAARALTPHKPEPKDEAVTLRRKEFDEQPGSGTYAALREAAIEAGVWTTQRVSAVARLRERAAESSENAEELVRALLAEERPDDAWRACLRFGGSVASRLELAASREATHPDEVIPVYRTQVEHLIEQKDAQAYREAAKHLKKLRTLHKRTGTAEEFTGYVAELVNVHRRKTRLVAEIRAARIAVPKARAPRPETVRERDLHGQSTVEGQASRSASR